MIQKLNQNIACVDRWTKYEVLNILSIIIFKKKYFSQIKYIIEFRVRIFQCGVLQRVKEYFQFYGVIKERVTKATNL